MYILGTSLLVHMCTTTGREYI